MQLCWFICVKCVRSSAAFKVKLWLVISHLLHVKVAEYADFSGNSISASQASWADVMSFLSEVDGAGESEKNK